MKKTFAILVSAILVCMMTVSIFAEYPGSPEWDYPLPTEGVLLQGTIIGEELGWDGTATSGAAAAFDGDTATFYDPTAASVDTSFCGLQLDTPYILTEIRTMPRSDNLPRYNGATIQGSNDGVEWVDIWDNYEDAPAQDYYCVTPADPGTGEWYITDQAFTYFRYFNPINHGDIVELELYGVPADGSTPAPAPAAAASTGFATLDEAAASIGKTAITTYEYIDGSAGNAGEGPETLWDNDTATKFCTATFPTISIAKLDGAYTIDGIIMATANDNAEYNDRSPFEWTISGSNDGENWTPIATGDDTFFEETNFTYYAKAVDASPAYEYIQFYSEGAISGTFQLSEVVVCGTAAAAAETPAEVETPAPAEEAPAPAPTAPATGDMFVIIAVVASVALAAVVVLKKVAVR